MSSRLPRSRPSRHRPPPSHGVRVVMTGSEESKYSSIRHDGAMRAAYLARLIAAAGARLDRDPNGYCIAADGRIVARCPNLDGVEAWLLSRDARHAHAREAAR